MQVPRVYADFNGIEYLEPDESVALLELTGYGTLASLSRQRLRLTEGLALVIYEAQEIEADATAHFDPSRKDPAGRNGAWVARLDARGIRPCQTETSTEFEHPCYGCGKELTSHFALVGRQYIERCPDCGTHVMTPMLPPTNAT